jgi:hypothetical protein
VRHARFALYAVLVALVFVLQSPLARTQGTGAIASPRDLAIELHATAAAPGAWPAGDEVPTRYRWLFRALVLQAERLSPALRTEQGFYGLYVGASALSLLLACVAFDVLLRRLRFSTAEATLGVVLYLAGFPIVFAYDMPIHTHEDLFANACLCAALVAVVADRPVATALLVALAANVREMSLLAALPFWFCSKRPRSVRAAVIGAATLATLLVTSIRELSPRIPWYVDRSAWHPTGQSTTANAPTEALLYVFLCFGAHWPAAIFGAKGRRERTGAGYATDLVGWPQGALCVLLALASSVALGQVREVRTVYFAFPWVVPLALEYFLRDFVPDMKLVRARVAGGIVLALGMVLLAMVARSHELVAALRPWIGGSFQPGFEAPDVYDLVSDGQKTDEVLVWPYTASPWNGVALVFHATLSAAIIAARAGGSGGAVSPPEAGEWSRESREKVR